MTAEIIMTAAAVTGSIIAVGGMALTWRKNGREQKQRDERIAKETAQREQRMDSVVQSLFVHLTDKDDGLPALNRKVEEHLQNCARISTTLTERVIAIDGRVTSIDGRVTNVEQKIMGSK